MVCCRALISFFFHSVHILSAVRFDVYCWTVFHVIFFSLSHLYLHFIVVVAVVLSFFLFFFCCSLFIAKVRYVQQSSRTSILQNITYTLSTNINNKKLWRNKHENNKKQHIIIIQFAKTDYYLYLKHAVNLGPLLLFSRRLFLLSVASYFPSTIK